MKDYCYCWLDGSNVKTSECFKGMQTLEEAIESSDKNFELSKRFTWVEGNSSPNFRKASKKGLVTCKHFEDKKPWFYYEQPNYVALKYGDQIRYLSKKAFKACRDVTPREASSYDEVNVDAYWFTLGFIARHGRITARIAVRHPSRVEYAENLFRDITGSELCDYSKFVHRDICDNTWSTRWTITFAVQPDELLDAIKTGVPVNNEGKSVHIDSNGNWLINNNFYCYEDLLRRGYRPGDTQDLDKIITNVSDIHRDSFLKGYSYDRISS